VTFTLLLVLGLIGTSVPLITRAALAPRTRAAATVRQIEDYGYATHQAAAPARFPVLDALATRLGDRYAHRLGGFREAEIRRELAAAGIYKLTPRKFLGYRILATSATPLVWFAGASHAGLPAVFLIASTGFAVAVGWMAPIVAVRKRAERRLAQVEDDLPELVDLLVVTIEAGLGFVGSMREASSRLDGPLGDELRLTLQEQHMGLSIDEALRNMLVRSDTPGMRSFVRGILQGETLGVSIGQIMRNLADDMRTRRRQSAEERAQKAPVKILFPLIFLIFPAMFVVLLAPAIFTFKDAIAGR
jgi:tight adherence protein C